MYRRFLAPRWFLGHLLVLLAALVCLRLGWWQWGRAEQRAGNAQNLGYAFLWPAFAVAFVYMWIRFMKLEILRDADEAAEVDAAIAQLSEWDGTPAGMAGPAPDDGRSVSEVSEPDIDRATPSQAITLSVATVGDEDEDDDSGLAEYNRALAALAQRAALTPKERRRAR